MSGFELLTVGQMYTADTHAAEAGVPGERLMEAAGWAVAREVRRRFPRSRVAVLCGPGNNGGDGFVAARLLARQGWPVKLALLGLPEALKGDARTMFERWQGETLPLSPGAINNVDVVVDALFGAGLARPLDGMARAVVEEIALRKLPVVAVDMPSGVHGDTGEALGVAPRAVATVTFFRKKPGHCLQPGRDLCGEVVVADIGIPPSAMAAVQPATFENAPGLWALPSPGAEAHKYDRGHVLVVGGDIMTGATRLAARAARRAGAGLVTITAPEPAVPIYRSGDPGTIVVPLDPVGSLLADRRRNAVLLGPGGGVGEQLAARVLVALSSNKASLLDADALTSFAAAPERLFAALDDRTVLTPHDGEFKRLFPDVVGSRLDRAREAARRSGAVVLLKGSDTVIAHPDGRAAVNTNAPAHLATAGSGDVLSGLIVGLLAQHMPAFEAACAGVWLHGACAARLGPGLIAEDIADTLPAVLGSLAP
ncbi:MAG: NAD(P)H-hydrate dehydratase [Actinomycetota bacterium]